MAETGSGTRPSGDGQAVSLSDIREPIAYNAAEQALSVHIQDRLQDLLQGRLNVLPLVRKSHRSPRRLSIPEGPAAVTADRVRLEVVEEMVDRTLCFLHAGQPGGPITQWRSGADLMERQSFSTQFPHILIEREDRYDAETRQPRETRWTVRRIQNQQQSIRVNRALDLANLGIEVLKTVMAFV